MDASTQAGGSLSQAGMAQEGAGVDDSVIVAPAGNEPIPAAFADAGNSERKLTRDEQRQVNEIQEEFANTVTRDGIGNDPTSPTYKKAWRDAKWLADQQFKALFGYQAFLQRDTAQQAAN